MNIILGAETVVKERVSSENIYSDRWLWNNLAIAVPLNSSQQTVKQIEVKLNVSVMNKK